MERDDALGCNSLLDCGQSLGLDDSHWLQLNSPLLLVYTTAIRFPNAEHAMRISRPKLLPNAFNHMLATLIPREAGLHLWGKVNYHSQITASIGDGLIVAREVLSFNQYEYQRGNQETHVSKCRKDI